jgi:indolepyruvate decarboxylase
MSEATVAAYLKQRLEELGLERLFVVAGNYTAPFLDTILEDPRSPIVITGIPNEICAGYAADGYARLRGIGAVAVTYGVGAFSLLNAVAGSLAEKAPVVVINGAPTNKEFQNSLYAGFLYSHMTSDPYSNLDVYRRITVNAERILNAGEAPHQIDAALSACISHGQPVYLEVLEDVWRTACRQPSGPLSQPGQSRINRA